MKMLNEKIVDWIRNIVSEADADGIVVGLSGGVDSSVVCALCKKTVGENLLALILPCHSESSDLADAEKIAELFSIKTEKVDLTPVYDQFISVLPSSAPTSPSPHVPVHPSFTIANANLKSRLRMLTLYHYANRHNYLVAGTGNRTEIEIGYFTKYGDGASDLLPLGGLLKREVRSLAGELGIPEEIIRKTPTAGLWKGQTDEGEIGMSYEELDDILSSIKTGATEKLNQENLAKVKKLIESSKHKREPAPKFAP